MSEGHQRKVVDLHAYGRGQGRLTPVEARRVLTGCRDRIAEYLSGAVTATMEQVDDVLFERADKAGSNTEQTVYFDAMREVRLRRSSVESRCRSVFLERFAAKLRERGGDEASGLDSMSMTLVDHEELEESIAASNMATKVRNICHQELFHLEKRLMLVLRRQEMKSEQNPLGPEVIFKSFRDACRDINIDLKAKLIVLKLFDRLAIPGMQNLYREINEFLAKNDVLPVIKHEVKRPAYQRPPQTPPAAGGTDTSGAYGQPGFVPAGETNPYLALRRFVGAPGGAVAGGPAGEAPAAASMVPVMSALTAIQLGGEGMPALGTLDAQALSSGTANVLRDIKGVPALQPLVQADGVTIDIVAMIFDHILDNRDLAASMKALIGRLQIPVLKVAILDKSFFASRGHPARRLLDELARAATGWSEEESRDEGSLFAEVEAIVETVLNEFKDDIGLFAELAERLTDFLSREIERAERVEERSAKALEGEERVMMAKVIVRDEIDRRTVKVRPPEAVTRFLGECWFTVLLLYFLREGEKGGNWKRSVDLMDTLLWSVQPKRTDRERQRLVGALGWLLEGLQSGMEMASHPDSERKGFFNALKECHAKALSDGRAQQQGHEARERDELAAAKARKLKGIEAYRYEIESVVPDLPPAEEVSVDEVMRYADFSEPGESPPERPAETSGERKVRYLELAQNMRAEHEQMEIEEITIGLPGEIQASEPESDDKYTAMVQNLPKGTWVEFTRSDGTTARGKLSWISPLTGVYLFTNRKGMKVEDRTAKGLAVEFRRGSAKLIEEQSLLDQALSSILTKETAGKPGASA